MQVWRIVAHGSTRQSTEDIEKGGGEAGEGGGGLHDA